jgi:hypothetical protein
MLRPTQPRLLTGLLCCGSLLAISCTGSIDDGKRSGSDPSSPGSTDPGAGSSDPGASTPGAGPSVANDVPNTCGADQLGPSPLHRLTRLEYDNTIHDLIGEDMKLSKAFGFDERAGEFAANFFTPISEMDFAQYATAAEAVAEKAAGSMATVVTCDPAADPAGCSTTFIKQFGRRAFRRPLDAEEQARYQTLFDLGRTGADFANGVRLVVQAMLQSPKFLYLLEGPGPLTQHQVAARLSYFLWNAPPDAELSAAADNGELGTMAVLHQHTQRLLADPRAFEMIKDFHTQWLGLEELPTETKDAKLYGDFDMYRPSMIEETGRFVTDVMKTDGGKLETLLTASYAIVNGPLAALYGAPGGGTATDWKRVELDPKQRAGVFTQGGYLAAHGAFDASSPIQRGLAIRQRFLCAPMPVPPPGADSTFPAATPSTTTRERFDKHRTNPTCASCHSLMDKLGYGFETYDAIGRFRTTENGAMVDDSGEILGTIDIDGPFKGAVELAHKLTGSKQVQQCVTTQWFRYAFGRLDSPADKCVLDALQKRFTGGGMRVTDLLAAIVESDAFRSYQPLK